MIARPALVADPGLRHLLRVTRRALMQVCRAIEEVTTESDHDPDKEAARAKEALRKAA